mmetsp:Transcript_19306/g.48303  ORF Transcript_19306/g.48303 Transcript_19306/m.48303 type:complete len:286 (-) Transcript_19306:464-1321(-)
MHIERRYPSCLQEVKPNLPPAHHGIRSSSVVGREWLWCRVTQYDDDLPCSEDDDDDDDDLPFFLEAFSFRNRSASAGIFRFGMGSRPPWGCAIFMASFLPSSTSVGPAPGDFDFVFFFCFSPRRRLTPNSLRANLFAGDASTSLASPFTSAMRWSSFFRAGAAAFCAVLSIRPPTNCAFSPRKIMLSSIFLCISAFASFCSLFTSFLSSFVSFAGRTVSSIIVFAACSRSGSKRSKMKPPGIRAFRISTSFSSLSASSFSSRLIFLCCFCMSLLFSSPPRYTGST